MRDKDVPRARGVLHPNPDGDETPCRLRFRLTPDVQACDGSQHRVNLVMSPRQLAIRLNKGWVMRDSLVQQVSRAEQIRFGATTTSLGEARSQKKIFGAVI